MATYPLSIYSVREVLPNYCDAFQKLDFLPKPATNKCSGCFKKFEHDLQRCSACKMHYYCNKKCQKKAWKHLNHKTECPKLKKLRLEYEKINAKFKLEHEEINDKFEQLMDKTYPDTFALLHGPDVENKEPFLPLDEAKDLINEKKELNKKQKISLLKKAIDILN